MQQADQKSIKEFCKLKRRLEAVTAPVTEQKAEATAAKKRARDALYEQLIREGTRCVSVNDDTFARIRKYSNRRAVSSDVLQASIVDVRETALNARLIGGGTVADALVQVLADAIARNRTTHKEYVAITKTKPRQCGAIEPASAPLRTLLAQYRSASQALSDANVRLKRLKEPVQQALAQQADLVKDYMTRSMVTSQRIHIAQANGVAQSYYLRRKRTGRRKRLSDEQFRDLVRDAVLECVGRECATVERATAALTDHAGRIVALILDRIEHLPKEYTERVTLDKGPLRPT